MAQSVAREQPEAVEDVSSFAKSLFRGSIPEQLVFPYPALPQGEAAKVRELLASLHEVAYDPWAAERDGWIGDDVVAELGERGLLGLSVPEAYGGQGLSQTGYCRVAEDLGWLDATLAVVLGVHQSIGLKGIQLFGDDHQRARFLPDLARGRRLAAFALTEPQAGSDAAAVTTRARREADGAWRLDGEKRWIGNGDRDVLVTFARIDEEDGGGHIALIVEGDQDGVSAPARYRTLGLNANRLMRVRFDGVRVPPENVLGEPGEGFKIALRVLNNGRMALGTGALGGARRLLELATAHTSERHQFGHPLADFELVREKLSWIVTHSFGLESMAYLTTGLVDRGVSDYSVESAMVKVTATEFLWYAVNRVFQLAGGQAYIAGSPYEKMLRDVRVLPIFEGSNDVLRLFVALSGCKPVADELRELDSVKLADPIRSIGLLTEYVVGRLQREVRPERITQAHASVAHLATPVSEQVTRLRSTTESLLRTYRTGITQRQWHLKRLAHAALDVYAQVATISRVTQRLDEQGPDLAGRERYLAEAFCTRAAARVDRQLRTVANNDDERTTNIATLTLEHRGYPTPLFT
jgi:acyl-CoA dehydrogenase family protein 9